MAKLGSTERAERVVRLLLALRHPKVAEALAARGFDDDDIKEGWSLLRAVTLQHMPRPSKGPDVPLSQRRLLAWYREWGTLTVSTLRRHYPDAAAALSERLAGGSPLQRAYALTTWLEALPLPPRRGGRGATGGAILALLAKRGLTADILAEIAGVAEIFRKGISSADLTTPEDFTAADDALWAYYIEWSHAIRTVLKDRRLLRGLGFLQNSRGGAAQEQDDEGANTPGGADGS